MFNTSQSAASSSWRFAVTFQTGGRDVPSNINRVTLSGNLTSDPELREAASTSVCQLRIACNSSRKTQAGEWEDKPNYFDVIVWGQAGINCSKFLSKGQRVTVDGRLDWSEWEKDGVKRQAVKIVANQVEFPSRGGAPADTSTNHDEIPF